jgi:GTP 3',8-cyclase
LRDRDPHPALPVLQDRFLRRIRYLRVSVTDRCNYRCAYCMPVDGWATGHKDELLRFEEVVRLVRLLAHEGVERVRLTGGEPLVRRRLTDLVAQIAAIPGIQQVAMTTNGHLLGRHAEGLYAAGLRSLNISLDSFDPDRFTRLTRGGDLAEVLSGITVAQSAGFTGIKINAVALRGESEAEAADVVARCWEADLTPRYIELMPVGGLDFQAPEHALPSAELLAHLSPRYRLVPEGRTLGAAPSGPAEYWRVVQGPYEGRRVGFIRPMSDDGFCGTCNRARLTARGEFRPCLANDEQAPMLQALRSGVSDEVLMKTLRDAVEGKLEAHRMRSADTVPLSVMTGIGG